MRTALAALLVVGLMGCQHEPQVVTKTVVVYSAMEDSWLVDCPTVPPPDRMVYKAATLKQRNDMWAASYLEQARLNAQCRVKTQEARAYNTQRQQQSAP